MVLTNKANSTVYFFDTKNNLVNIYMVNQSGHIVEDGKKINEIFDTKEYYDEITKAIKEYSQKYPVSNASNLTVVLSDNCVFNNTVSFPLISQSNLQQAYKTYITNNYKNYDLLNIVSQKIASNRQFVTYSIVGVKQELIDNIKNCFKEANVMVGNITFESSADIAGLTTLDNRLKNQSYLFLDVKEDKTKIILVNKGRTIGFFNLGLGYSSLSTKPCEEDVLLYSPEAELVVVNAKEKANQKMLSTGTESIKNEVSEENGDEELEFDFNVNKEEVAVNEGNNPSRQLNNTTVIKTLPKKTARRLPKYMFYGENKSEEEIQYNNFRIFMRWTLDILKNNDKLISVVKPTTAYVNFPIEFNSLIQMANNEAEENGIKFVQSNIKGEKKIIEKLELFGALYTKQYNQIIKF